MIENGNDIETMAVKLSRKKTMMRRCYERSICARARAERIMYSTAIIEME